MSGGSILGHSSFLLALCPRLMFSHHRPRPSPNQSTGPLVTAPVSSYNSVSRLNVSVLTRGGIWAVSARWAECPSILSPTRVSERWTPGRAAKVELRGFTPS